VGGYLFFAFFIDFDYRDIFFGAAFLVAGAAGVMRGAVGVGVTFSSTLVVMMDSSFYSLSFVDSLSLSSLGQVD
jgi:hypothetical protein